MLLDRVVQEFAASGKVRVIAERIAQRVPVIAITGHRVDRRIQWREQVAQKCVLLRQAMLRSVAGKDDDVRLLLVDVRDGPPQAVGPQLRCGMLRCRRQYVRIADLGD